MKSFISFQVNVSILCIVLMAGVFSPAFAQAPGNDSLFRLHRYADNGNVFLCFAGWTVSAEHCEVWMKALIASEPIVLNPSVSVAVSGPQEACYTGSTLDTILVQLLLNDVLQAEKIIVVAHSSGSFVAHEFFEALSIFDSSGVALSKIYYANLDGGIGETCGYLLQPKLARSFAKIQAAFAKDSTTGILSPNAETMQRLHFLYPENSRLYIHYPNNGVCLKKWCLHETLITKKPYNTNSFDLRNDYGGINHSHPVETGWILPLLSDYP